MRIILITLFINLLIFMNLNAKIAAVIGDPITGEVFFKVNKDTKNYPASLTKMMTLYSIFDFLTCGIITKLHIIIFSYFIIIQIVKYDIKSHHFC